MLTTTAMQPLSTMDPYYTPTDYPVLPNGFVGVMNVPSSC